MTAGQKNVTAGLEAVLERIDAALRAEGPEAALFVGEEYAHRLDPGEPESFEVREAIFEVLAKIRREHDVNLTGHVVTGVSKGDKAAGAGHPLRKILDLDYEIRSTQAPVRKARRMADYAKVLFSIGYLDEAQRVYESALKIDACPHAMLGLAALHRYRMNKEEPLTPEHRGYFVQSRRLLSAVLKADPKDEAAQRLWVSLLHDAQTRNAQANQGRASEPREGAQEWENAPENQGRTDESPQEEATGSS